MGKGVKQEQPEEGEETEGTSPSLQLEPSPKVEANPLKTEGSIGDDIQKSEDDQTSKMVHLPPRQRDSADQQPRVCCSRSNTKMTLFLLLTIAIVWITVRVSRDVRYDTEDLRALLQTAPIPGEDLYTEGWRSHHPVVLVPGIVSGGLELWQGEDTSRSDFRQRVWGSSLMVRHMLLRTNWWIQHMKLDPETGLDPPGIKLRAATGLQAADYLVPGYWVWAKLIESLGAVGYDSNSMFMAAYDWRLAFRDSQRRDFYLTKLKMTIELAKLSNRGRKVVIVAHSMGCTKLLYFMRWVEHERGGKGGPNWVNDHIHAVFNIGGPFLGVPKSVAALISGEMRDTAELSPALNYVRQHLYFDNTDIQVMLRSFRSVASMLPNGGERIWGSTESWETESRAARQRLKELDALRKQDQKNDSAAEDGGSVVEDRPTGRRDQPSPSMPASVQEDLFSGTPDSESDDGSVDNHGTEEGPWADELSPYMDQRKAALMKAEGRLPYQRLQTHGGAPPGLDEDLKLPELPRDSWAPDMLVPNATITDPEHPHLALETTQETMECPPDTAQHNAESKKSALHRLLEAQGAMAVVTETEIGLSDLVRTEFGPQDDFQSFLASANQFFFDLNDNFHRFTNGLGSSNDRIREFTPSRVSRKKTRVPSGGAVASEVRDSHSNPLPEDGSAKQCRMDDSASRSNGTTSQEPSSPNDDLVFATTVPLNISATFDWMRRLAPEFMEQLDQLYSHGLASEALWNASQEVYRDDDRFWTNPLESQLPKAPNMTIICAYGVGKATERGYFFKRNPIHERQPSVPYVIDADLMYQPLNINHGVRLSDGDGTVPLISLGFMCQKGWKLPRFNPHGVQTVIREYREQMQSPIPLMRLADSADHVDIMGNSEMISDIVKLVGHQIDPVTGRKIPTHTHHELEERIYSEIEEISERVDLS